MTTTTQHTHTHTELLARGGDDDSGLVDHGSEQLVVDLGLDRAHHRVHFLLLQRLRVLDFAHQRRHHVASAAQRNRNVLAVNNC